MTNPIVPEQAAAQPPVPKSRLDRYGAFTAFWCAWAIAAALVEALAIYRDKQEQDRVKRTLSSNTRTAFGWDSITGKPLAVQWGRTRRTAFICLVAWFPAHVQQLGRSQGHSV
jgi:cyanate permease